MGMRKVAHGHENKRSMVFSYQAYVHSLARFVCFRTCLSIKKAKTLSHSDFLCIFAPIIHISDKESETFL